MQINFYDLISKRLKPSGLNRYQLDVLHDPHRFKTLVWHRRAGKTTASMVYLLQQSQLRIGVYWHIFPTYAEAKDAIWRDPNMLFKIIPEELILKKNENELTVTFRNKSILRLKGADQPDTLRGSGPVGIVFDEFQKQKIEAWHVISKVLARNQGWAMFVGTPAGRNHLFDFYERGLDNPRFPQWKSWYLKASESGLIATEELEREWEERLSDEFYNQEWEVAWLEGVGQVFKGVKAIAEAIPQIPLKEHLYVMGVDIAKHEDYTVITVFDRSNNMQVYQERFNKIDWPLQRERVAEISKHYNGAICALDATGVGDVFADELARGGTPVTPIKITEPLKREMIQKLSMWIQQKRFLILNNEDTIVELENFAYKKGPTGKYRYEAPSGKHDDIVMSLALAVLELNPVITPEMRKQVSPLQAYKESLISDMHGDDEYFENLQEWERL